MEITPLNLERIRLSNIVNMGLAFSAMIRLYEKNSKELLREKILESLPHLLSGDCAQFEKYHESICNWGTQNIVLTEKVRNKKLVKKACPPSYGQIAKTLNVVLKVVVYYCNYPDPTRSAHICKWLHAAIDNNMMRFLKKEYSDHFMRWPMSVEAVDKYTYQSMQQLVRKFIVDHDLSSFLPVHFDDWYWVKLKGKIWDRNSYL